MSNLPRRLFFLDLETRGGLRDFDRIEVLVGGGIECVRSGKYTFRQRRYESWNAERVQELRDRLLAFDGLIVGMNLYGYDYRVLNRYFDVGPLLPKTLDFQYELWRKGSGAVALGTLAVHNTRRRKVAGADMASIWDKGDRAYVLKRNRVDCELTAAVYWKFLSSGHLRSRNDRSFWLDEDGQPEDLLVFAGVMSRFCAEEWRWRIHHHNGVRGDRRFNGLPWEAHPDHDPEKPGLYFSAACPDCSSDTLACGPNSRVLDEWLAQLRCPRCQASYGPPRHSAFAYPGERLYEVRAQEHKRYQAWKKERYPSHRVEPTPTRVRRSMENLSSFHFVSPIAPAKYFPFTPSLKERSAYELLEADARYELGRTGVRRQWNPWHPTWDFWRSRAVDAEVKLTQAADSS